MNRGLSNTWSSNALPPEVMRISYKYNNYTKDINQHDSLYTVQQKQKCLFLQPVHTVQHSAVASKPLLVAHVMRIKQISIIVIVCGHTHSCHERSRLLRIAAEQEWMNKNLQQHSDIYGCCFNAEFAFMLATCTCVYHIY